MSFEQIDFSKLPAPDVIEQVSYEETLAAMLDHFRSLDETFTATVESDPAFKIIETAAYWVYLLRQQFNARAKGCLLAYAKGGDLEHLAAFFGVSRNVAIPGNPNAIPPVEEVLESDDSLRRRAQLALEGLSVAGPVGAYTFHALSVPGVKDVSVDSPTPGDVRVVVLSTTDEGAASVELLQAVDKAVNHEEVRPLTDNVSVMSAGIVPFDLQAEIFVFPGPDIEVVRALAEEAVAEVVAKAHAVGKTVYRSALLAALHVEGVSHVSLASPASDVVISNLQAPHCSSIAVTASEA